MTPVPWPLIGPPQPPCAPNTPEPAPAPAPNPAKPPQPGWAPPGIGADATPYPTPGYPLPAGAPFWIRAEADRLRLLAEQGGDLTAHKAVHLEGTR